MRADKFTKVTIEIFEKWLNYLYKEFQLNGYITQQGTLFSFPKNIIFAESKDHYIAEIVGEQKLLSPNTLKFAFPKKNKKIQNVNSYLNAGFPVKDEEKAVFNFAGGLFADFAVYSRYDKELIDKKLNIKSFGLSIVPTQEFEPVIPLNFGKNVDKQVIYDVSTIRADSFRLFYRYMSTVIVIKKNNSLTQYKNWLIDTINKCAKPEGSGHLLGLNSYPESFESIFAKKLRSLAYENVNELDIDEFILNHSNDFAKCLGYSEAKSKIKLKIIDNKGWDRSHLIPDYLMQKEHGELHDILDLKKGLLKYRKLTKNGKSRIRFVDYLEELIAQLEGYRKYFMSQENSNWALQNKGIRVENPKLIGIVGNHNNFIREDIDLALERYWRNDIIILSYNEIVNLIRLQNNLQKNSLA